LFSCRVKCPLENMQAEKILSFILATALLGCSVFDKKTREYNRKLKNQKIPTSLLATTWELTSTSDDSKPCHLTLSFKDKGQLLMEFKDNEFEGTYLIGKENEFSHLFVGFIPKIVWTDDRECNTNPSNFSLYVNGDNLKYELEGEKLTIKTKEKEFEFRKV
jgi:hypothetical protein